MTLPEMGWRRWTAEAWAARKRPEGAVPARICSSLRGAFRLWTEQGEVEAPARAKLMRAPSLDRPTTGDWGVLQLDPPLLLDLLPRRAQLVRKAPGEKTAAQVLAANLDTVLIVAGLDRDFNPRRLERYLAMAWESGADPVVVLNKADLAEDLDEKRDAAAEVAGDAPVIVSSAQSGEGMDELRRHLRVGDTVALTGSSGVGKSALTNRLLGARLREVGAVRAADGRGRHTTVGRELILAPDGWIFMDLPGIREVRPWSGEGVEDAFADVEELLSQCRFSNCRHSSEPGCAIREALESGRLDRARYANYLKVQDELAVLERRRVEQASMEAKKRLQRGRRPPGRPPKRRR